MTIKLYELCGSDKSHLFSPHCWKTRYSLAHKGLDYEIIPTVFTDIATIEGGTNRTVPTIKDGNTIMDESLEIAHYLDTTYPDKPSLIGDSLSLTRFVATWANSQIHPEVAKICLLDIYNSLAPADQEFFRRTREARFGCSLEDFSSKFPKDGVSINKVLSPLQILLQNQDYLGGDTPTFADYIIFGPLQWLRLCSSVDIPIDSPVSDWFARLLDLYDGLGRQATRP